MKEANLRKERFAKKLVAIALAIIAITIWLPIPGIIEKVFAVDLTEAAMRLDRMAASTADVDILVVAKPASTNTENDLYITFASGFDVDATPANITASTANIAGTTFNGEALTAWPGVGTSAAASSSQNVTFNSSDLTVGTLYAFTITAGIDNPAAAQTHVNTISTRTSGDAVIDTRQVAVDVVSGSTDQVSVGATVPPTFNFALDVNAVNFGSLSSSSVSVGTTVNIDIDTNASNGWSAWLSSANQGLDSASTSETIDTSGSIDGTPTTVTAGTDYYHLDVEVTNGSGTGTPSVAAEYNGQHGDPYSGGTFGSSLTEIATSDGPGTNDAVALFGLAAMVSTKQAASDYIDTWTVVGAANF